MPFVIDTHEQKIKSTKKRKVTKCKQILERERIEKFENRERLSSNKTRQFEAEKRKKPFCGFGFVKDKIKVGTEVEARMKLTRPKGSRVWCCTIDNNFFM